MASQGRDVSPELVLVSPDLAESARAGLPERPSEMFAWPVALRPPRAASAPRQEALDAAPVRRSGNGSRFVAALAIAGFVAVGALADNRKLPAVKTDVNMQPQPIPWGNYVFGADGQIRVAPGGRTAQFQSTMRCLGRLVLLDIPLSSRGSFTTRRSLGGLRGTVVLSGRFVKPLTITGTLRGYRTGCDSGRAAFRARLT